VKSFQSISASKVKVVFLGEAVVPMKTVLIVDDHEAVRLVLRRYLESMVGFEVIAEASNGVEAVEKALRVAPDIVILDFAMPEMNGLEAATAIKLMRPSVITYLLTIHSTREVELAAREAGVDAVFSKHKDLGALLRRVRENVSRPGNETEEKPTSGKQRADVTPNDKRS
jgi:DNA-binding NarL/FixJ family response regulator